ncbi:MAG: type II toxin-antitoxin system RelE/ParE family toxin [Actinomycetota bacterium]
MTGPWEIEETEDVAMWLTQLTDTQRAAVESRLLLVRSLGPAVSRPYVDTLRGSAIKNLKELRVSSGGAIRVLFVFDPKRRAVLLLGGNKAESSRWNDWYRTAIPRAEQLFREHLERMEAGS